MLITESLSVFTRTMDAIVSRRKIAGLDEFDSCTCLNLRKATRAVTQFYENLLEPTGLKITQLPILAEAATLGPVTMTKLSERLVMDRTTLTRNLQPLVRMGFIKVRAGEDRRARLVSVTQEGLEALEGARRVIVHLYLYHGSRISDSGATGAFQLGCADG